MTSIVFTAAGTAAEAVVSGKLTAGIVGVPVTFDLNEEWDGLNVIAVFEGGGNRISLPLMGRKTIPLPWEVVARPNIRLRIGAEGRAEDGSVVIPTVWADAAYVAWGVNATQGSAPSPTAFDILMAEIRKVSEGHLPVVDDLETRDSAKALSANMGAYLREKIDNDLLTVRKELGAQVKERVKTINGIGPDENGNVNVEGGGGLTSTEKSLLLSLFKNAAYTADMSAIIAQLETLWSGGDIPDEPVEPELPEADVSQTGSVLSIVSGVTANQSGSVLAIA